MKAGLIEFEDVRLALLRGYGILDTAPEQDFDDLVELASAICETPIALISLVEDDRQWFKARHGTNRPETPIDMSMCAHAIQSGDYLEIPDTTRDPRTANNRLVTGEEGIRFYAGALLQGEDGLPLGTLCVLDRRPRRLNELQRRTLLVLATQVMRQIELRKAVADAEVLRKEVDHRVKNSLQSIEALIRLQVRQEGSEAARAALETVQGRLHTVSSLHEALYLTDVGAVVGLAPFLERVMRAARVQLPGKVRVDSDFERLDVPSRDAASVGMILNEAIANAGKYAFKERDRGTLTIRGRRDGETYELSCRDDGPGAPEGVIKGTGLGMRIMQAAAQQLQGTLDVADTVPGHCLVLRWPIHRN